MGGRMVGDLVEVPFPYTDLSGQKSRPTVVLADVGMGDWLLCEITGRRRSRPGDIAITSDDLAAGELDRNSWARPSRIHALHQSLFEDNIGRLTDSKLAEVLAAVRALF